MKAFSRNFNTKSCGYRRPSSSIVDGGRWKAIEMSGYAYYKSRTAGLVLIWAMGGGDGAWHADAMMTDFRLHKSHFSPFVRTDAKSNGGTGVPGA